MLVEYLPNALIYKTFINLASETPFRWIIITWNTYLQETGKKNLCFFLFWVVYQFQGSYSWFWFHGYPIVMQSFIRLKGRWCCLDVSASCHQRRRRMRGWGGRRKNVGWIQTNRTGQVLTRGSVVADVCRGMWLVMRWTLVDDGNVACWWCGRHGPRADLGRLWLQLSLLCLPQLSKLWESRGVGDTIPVL